jgi:hypothetical protein
MILKRKLILSHACVYLELLLEKLNLDGGFCPAIWEVCHTVWSQLLQSKPPPESCNVARYFIYEVVRSMWGCCSVCAFVEWRQYRSQSHESGLDTRSEAPGFSLVFTKRSASEVIHAFQHTTYTHPAQFHTPESISIFRSHMTEKSLIVTMIHSHWPFVCLFLWHNSPDEA